MSSRTLPAPLTPGAAGIALPRHDRQGLAMPHIGARGPRDPGDSPLTAETAPLKPLRSEGIRSAVPLAHPATSPNLIRDEPLPKSTGRRTEVTVPALTTVTQIDPGPKTTVPDLRSVPCNPLDELPSGTVKIPLNLPHGAAWPVLAQVAALSQRPQGCTASADYLAERLTMARETVQRALAEVAPWIVATPAGRRVRRHLAPLAEHIEWARISYRAAAGVGCHPVDGEWIARHNRSLLLELYARLRHAEDTGHRPTATALGAALGVTRVTVQVALATLVEDGWITKVGRGAYATQATILRPVADVAEAPADVLAGSQVMYQPDHTPCISQVTPEAGTLSTNLKQDPFPLAVGVSPAVPACAPTADAERAKPVSEGEQATTKSSDREREQAAEGVLAAFGIVAALPTELIAGMSEADRDKVMRAAEVELVHRSPVALAARVRRRLHAWRGHDIRRPVAVALTVLRRGYNCPRPDCEDHMLPSGHECGACAAIGAEVNHARLEAVAPLASAPSEPMPPAATPTKASPSSQKRERLEFAGDTARGAAAGRAALIAARERQLRTPSRKATA